MFSLIIAIVAIALIVAVTLVGSYYMGGSVSDASAKSEAARLKNEEQQILAGSEMFRADQGRWPTDVQELVSRGYLSSVPKGLVAEAGADLQLISSAYAQAAEHGWVPAVNGQPIYVSTRTVPEKVCRQYNLVSRGDDGILLNAYQVLPAQCYGTADNFHIVFFKPAAGVMRLSEAIGPVALEGGLPAPSGGDSWWATTPTGDVKVPLDPEKVPTPVLAASVGNLSFGPLPVGTTSAPQTLTLTNTGNMELTGLAVSDVPAGFLISKNTCGSSLPVRSTCELEVSFHPADPVAYEGSISFTSNAPAVSVQLEGGGQRAELRCAAAGQQDCTFNFGDVTVGETVVSTARQLTNAGNRAITALSVTVPSGFSLQQNTCTSQLAPGASCTFSVAFSPAAMQAYPGSVVIAGEEVSSQSFAMGTPRGIVNRIVADRPLAQNLGVGPALAHHYAQYNFRNTGNVDVTLGALSVTSGTGFVDALTCTSGKVLLPDQSCTLDVGFRADQDETANLAVSATLQTSAGDQVVSLSGSSKQLAWSIVSVPQTEWVVGTAYPHTYRLTNNAPVAFTFGGGTVGNGKFELAPGAVSTWEFVSTTCGATLAPAASCDVTVRVTPAKVNVADAAQLYPRGSLPDFANGVAGQAQAPKRFKVAPLTGIAKPVNFSSLLASYVNSSYLVTPNANWLQDISWYSTQPGGSAVMAAGAVAIGKTLTVAGNDSVKAKLRFSADNFIRYLKVNGTDVGLPTGGAYNTRTDTVVFTLLPGVNAITLEVVNSGADPGGWSIQVWDEAGTTKLSDASGWNYAGAAQVVQLTGSPLAYANGTAAASCNAYRNPQAGYQVASVSGYYTVNMGSGNETVYCDQATDGGGWTLVGRSAPNAAAANNFGWRGVRGSVTSFADAYSMGALNKNLPFTQVLFGGAVAGTNTWGAAVYRTNASRANMLAASTEPFYAGVPYALTAGASGSFYMALNMGFTSNSPNSFFFRDMAAAPDSYGLHAGNWQTAYGDGPNTPPTGTNPGSPFGGNLNGLQGMLMVR